MLKKLQTIFVRKRHEQPVTGKKLGAQSYISPPQQTEPVKQAASPRVVSIPKEMQTNQRPPPQNTQLNISEEIKAEEDNVKKSITEERKLDNLITNSHKVLFKCSAVFPFDLFPDELSIESTQVNVKRKVFFLTAQSSSVPVKNISDVILSTSIFFSSIRVVDQYFAQNSIDVSFLKKDDALKVKKIIQGLVIAVKEDVDPSRITPNHLVNRAEKLGEMQAIDES
jgi:hypothetical protein